MEHRGTPPWDTRPDLIAIEVTRPEVVIRGYDDRDSDERHYDEQGDDRRHQVAPRSRPSRPRNPRPVAYLVLSCLGALVLPGVMGVALWLRSGWSLSPAVLIPPSPASTAASSTAVSGTTPSGTASSRSPGPGHPTRAIGHAALPSGEGPAPVNPATAGGAIPSSAPGPPGHATVVNSIPGPPASTGAVVTPDPSASP